MELDNNAVALVFNTYEAEDGMYVSLDLYTDLTESSNIESPEAYALFEALRAANALRYFEEYPEAAKQFEEYVLARSNKEGGLSVFSEVKGRA